MVINEVRERSVMSLSFNYPQDSVKVSTQNLIFKGFCVLQENIWVLIVGTVVATP